MSFVSFIHSFVHSYTHKFIHAFIRSFIRPFIHLYGHERAQKYPAVQTDSDICEFEVGHRAALGERVDICNDMYIYI